MGGKWVKGVERGEEGGSPFNPPHSTHLTPFHPLHPFPPPSPHSTHLTPSPPFHPYCLGGFISATLLKTAVLLGLSNIFMTFAWYGHLRNLSAKPWYVAAIVSWGIALFEYLLQVPANRIGYSALTLGQLKILQEVITLAIFVPFAVFYMKESFKLDYLWAALCLLGAVYFIFRVPPA